MVCLALAPLVLHLARQLGMDPRPHLVGLAVASNLGSAATLTGNPQNMIIGGLSGIPYLRFAARLAPPALIGLLVGYAVTLLAYRSALRTPSSDSPDEAKEGTTDRPPPGTRHTALLVKSLVVTVTAVGLFFAGFPMAVVALGAAAVLLLDRVKPEAVYDQIDWSLLVMFAGLFVVVHAFEVHVLAGSGVEARAAGGDPVWALSALSAVLSNLVSNVPAVLLFKPVIAAMPEAVRETAWLALAASSTFAGNLTVLGSVANLIVIEQARKDGVAIGFWDYCRVGIPVTAADAPGRGRVAGGGTVLSRTHRGAAVISAGAFVRRSSSASAARSSPNLPAWSGRPVRFVSSSGSAVRWYNSSGTPGCK